LSNLASVSVSFSSSHSFVVRCLFHEKFRFYLQYVLIKVSRLETSHGDIQVGLHDRGDVALVYTIVECLDVIVVRENPIDFGLYKDVGDDCRQMVSCDLLVLVQGIRLFNDFHDFLELLKLAEWSLLLLHPTGFFNCHLPSMAHRVFDLHSKGACWKSLKHGHLPLEFFLFVALVGVVEELRVEVVHHEVTDFHHVMVKFVVIPQEWILLELPSCDLKQLLEELSET
jgi:hypothetical protein